MDNNNEKIQLLQEANLASIFFIISTIISIYVINNQINKLNNKPYFDSYEIELYNRILVVILFLTFLYINYKNYDLAKQDNLDLTPYNLQLINAILSLAGGIIVVYVILYQKNNNINIADLSNPEL